MPLLKSRASRADSAGGPPPQHQLSNIDNDHQVITIFPTLALLSHGMQLWIPPSRAAESIGTDHNRRGLKREYTSHKLDYDLFTVSLTERTAMACTNSDASAQPPTRFEHTITFHQSPAYMLAESIQSLTVRKGSTRLEMATYVVGKTGSNNIHVHVLDAVVFRVRSTTSLLIDHPSPSSLLIYSSKLYEFPLRDWLTLRADLEGSGSCTDWWDSLDTQLWRATETAYMQVTKRLVAQGVREADSLLRHTPRRKVKAAQLQRSLGLAGLLDDVDNIHLNNYIIHKSRTVSSVARWHDCVVLPLLREIAPLGCDANWIETMAETQRQLAVWKRRLKPYSKTPKHVRRELRPLLALWRMGDARMERQAWLEEALQAADADAAEAEVDLDETLHTRVEKYKRELLSSTQGMTRGNEGQDCRRISRFEDYPWVHRA